MEKKNPLSDLMRDGMDKMRQMVDTNAIVGQPICTPDGVTLIPISRVSMGFGGGGATREDVDLMVKNVGEGILVKAAGGISGIQDAEDFIKLGADRLGTSRVVKIAKNHTDHSGY